MASKDRPSRRPDTAAPPPRGPQTSLLSPSAPEPSSMPSPAPGAPTLALVPGGSSPPAPGRLGQVPMALLRGLKPLHLDFSTLRRLPGLTRLPRFRREADGLPEPLGRIGALEVRLARTARDVRRAQRLRFKVFYEEMGAEPNAAARLSRRDRDPFDAVCDHLLVLDHGGGEGAARRRGSKPKVVGTYRLLRQEVADASFGFYTATEYDIRPLIAAHPGMRFLELGRSCVLAPYRTKRTVELLWHGIWTYVLHHRVDAMIGCASLEGTDPAKLALPLSYLHHYARAPDALAARPVEGRRVPMDILPKDLVDPKMALRALPPLIRGYLRVGATFGDGAVVDPQFGTTDVFVVLRVADIAARYVSHYGADASRHAA